MDTPIIEQQMHGGKIYDPNDAQLARQQLRCLNRLRRFNKTHCSPFGIWRRGRLLRRMFAEIGPMCYIEPPFHANWGGRHVHFGSQVYANFNLTLVDDTHIDVGNRTMFGPNVTVATAAHPIWPEPRGQALQYNLPVRIGENCWIGSGAMILPGVTIGDNVVIGAGSVVTKDIPPNVVAVGNPCRVLREIDERDRANFEFRM